VHTEFAQGKAKPYCRSSFAAIESIIHATRLSKFSKNISERKKLVSLIRYYGELVNRISPNSNEAKIIRGILVHFGN
jgi:hypothetical protein